MKTKQTLKSKWWLKYKGTMISILIILLVFLLGAIVYGADNNYFTSQEFNISVLFINGTQRITDGNCNISIYYPNGSISLNNSAMMHTGYGWYSKGNLNYSVIGGYKCDVICYRQNDGLLTTCDFKVDEDIKTVGWQLGAIIILGGIAFAFIILSKILSEEYVPIKMFFFALGLVFAMIITWVMRLIAEANNAGTGILGIMDITFIVVMWVVIFNLFYMLIYILIKAITSIKAKPRKPNEWESFGDKKW